jgi:hypothetical protein
MGQPRLSTRPRLKKPPLRFADILRWADEFHAKHGRWPNMHDGVVTDIDDTRFSAMITITPSGTWMMSTSPQSTRVVAVNEHVVDLLLVEEIYCSLDFIRWLLSKIDFAGISPAVASIHDVRVFHSISDATGETDVVVDLSCDVDGVQEPVRLLIENKVNAAFQDRQPERYLARLQPLLDALAGKAAARATQARQVAAALNDFLDAAGIVLTAGGRAVRLSVTNLKTTPGSFRLRALGTKNPETVSTSRTFPEVTAALA